MRQIKLSTALLIALSQVISTPAICAIPRTDRPSQQFKLTGLFTPRFDRGVDLTAIQPIVSKRTWKSEDISMIIPQDMRQTNDQSLIATQILDQSLRSLWNSEEMRQSDIGKSATRVEKSMQKDLVLGGESANSVKHVFKFAVKPVQTKAQVEYSGIVNGSVSYQVAGESLDLEIHRDVARDTRVAYNRVYLPSEQRDIVSLRWSF